ncbi:hypothetical protein B0H10DRAFT_1692218, partial [Mycena sp. CBHHK59/15]
ALSPQEICDRITRQDNVFQKALVNYLEIAHVGEFLTGTLSEVRSKVPYVPKPLPFDYAGPTQVLLKPLLVLCENCSVNGCSSCLLYKTWRTQYLHMVDDLILRSNVKGCTCKDGSCSAQFPRNVFANMEVDLLDGSINVKKLEPMINNVTPALTYSLRCNTDITSLLSGTSIKAVVAYISDYVTKASLKTYYIFQSVCDIFDK